MILYVLVCRVVEYSKYENTSTLTTVAKHREKKKFTLASGESHADHQTK